MSAGEIRRRLEATVQHKHTPGCLRIPAFAFGVKSAPRIFQAIMDNMLAGLPFATAYLDDTVVVSRSPDDHRRHLHAVFDHINEYEFRVRLGKGSFHTSIKYLGFVIDNDGRSPDPKKITAVADMPAPAITTLHSFLRLVSYYQSFIPNMHSHRQPLDDFPKDNE